VATGGALIGYSFPTFFIGLVLLYFVIFKFKIMAYPAYTPFADDPVAWLKSFILPWITLALVFAAFYSRLTRNQMLDTLGEDYIRTARAKGLSERRVIGKHALRSGLTPIVTLYVTPVFYTYLDDLQSWLGRLSSKLPWSSEHKGGAPGAPVPAGD
jgi:peptide/nickel transport system permease protein